MIRLTKWTGRRSQFPNSQLFKGGIYLTYLSASQIIRMFVGFDELQAD